MIGLPIQWLLVKVTEPFLKKKKRNEQTADQQRPDDYTNSEGQENTKKKRTLYLPYVRGVSEKVERTCRSINNQEYRIRKVFQPVYTIQHMLTKVKIKLSDDKKKSLVYEIPCQDWEHLYVGETKKTLKRCIVDHEQAMKKFGEKNGVAVHANTHDHHMNWEEAKV